MDAGNRLLEQYMNRPLSGAEKHDVEESVKERMTLKKVAQGLKHAIQDIPWELPTSVALDRLSRSLARDPTVFRLVEQLRVQLFASPEPPFSGLGDAHEWIVELVGDVDDVLEAVDRENKAGYTIVEECRARAWEATFPAQEMFEWAVTPMRRRVHLVREDPDEWLSRRELGDALGERYPVPQDEDVEGLEEPYNLPGEHSYPAHGGPLRALSDCAAKLSEVTNCWSRGEATQFILTAQVPRLRRLRLRSSEIGSARSIKDPDLPGGGIRFSMELFGVVTWDEWKVLYLELRRRAGVSRKKGLSPLDLEVIEFMRDQPPDRPRNEVLREWNEAHPGRSAYAHYSSLWNKYKRTLGRLDTP